MSVIVSEDNKALEQSVSSMLAHMRILPLTHKLSDYERAKRRWGLLCLSSEEYEAGLKTIADWVGV